MIRSYSACFFLLILFICPNLAATEYRYLVGYNEKSQTGYYIWQTDPLHLELYAFDTATQKYSKLLPNYFNPVGFRLLPSCNGFSFIHNDMIYLKQFSKRSPKRIEFFEPIYGINTIEWIDEESFYFAARQGGHYRIYEGNTEGDLETIVSDDSSDALYPQKIDDQLFYIERTSDKAYHIVHTGYKNNDIKKIIANVEEQPIACLSMINQNQGFFLAYPSIVHQEDAMLTFSYYQLAKEEIWKTVLLFNFSIPKEYLAEDSSSRAFESIIPFLPRYHAGELALHWPLISEEFFNKKLW